MSGNYSRKVLITLDHTSGSRTILSEYLVKHGAIGVISCREYHGGTKQKMEERVADDSDTLNDANKYHLCAAAFGNFHKKNLTNRGRTWAQKTFENPDQHWSTMYAHVHENANGKKTYNDFPFPEMLEYLTKSSEKKDVDDEPYIIIMDEKGEYEETTATGLLNKYWEFSEPFEAMRTMKKMKYSENAVLQNVYTLAEEDPSKAHYFMKFFESLPIQEGLKILPEGLNLRPWQQKIVSWANIPKSTDLPNGLWLNLSAGEGKTTILQALWDTLGGQKGIYILPIRANGSYDTVSMMDYAGQPLIIIDDLTYHTQDGVGYMKSTLKELLKRMTETFPIAFKFGNHPVRNVIPMAKVLVTSNYPLPVARDARGKCPFDRRYMEISSQKFPEEFSQNFLEEKK